MRISVIDGRALRKRRQGLQSSAYSAINNIRNINPNTGYAQNFIGPGRNWYPIGNRWFRQDNPPYPYNNQFGYNAPPLPYGYPSWLGTSTALEYGAPWLSQHDSYVLTAYSGQSFVPPSSDYYFMPLPGTNRHRQ
ncbi:unnamed protein product [Rotaria sp. Silwood1]|nr:unnamed protein product [Rotaria sp. Silwood1]CAF1540294.1 unnamed protein product [Rotaria sp. Silwood1]CAF3645715.1 unnamed protein product [Rotaria sp. Silwood1]CAF3684766.1 unnamed protein product [Rotaria sp. Silwood1]CAF3697591.1 unnamed protein product [Rotaria sp. Silwood1]